METLLQEILDALRHIERLDYEGLAKIIYKHNKGLKDSRDHFSKKKILPYYFTAKETDPELWTSWDISPELEKRLIASLQVKPRRTSSGVATITVITKPWKCSSNCLYCPNDLRMPKSYLSDEPACQRAERNYFDPYLQVASRLQALKHMGHVTDKIELIVLGGTWSDYPKEYQTWFMTELFRALNDNAEMVEERVRAHTRFYESCGLSHEKADLAAFVADKQQRIREGELTYNQAAQQLYERSEPWLSISAQQTATLEALTEQHTLNETAEHRMVGLVIETRPDTVTPENLTLLRQFGCTKIQMGIQSLEPAILRANHRTINVDKIQESFELLRLFGFKIHAHFMLNLYEATPEKDKQDYKRFVTDAAFQPDEVKLYPCALVANTGLCAHYEDKSWRPYTEEELVSTLAEDTIITPAFTRISRMIRDISAHDILVGNKKTNLRQMVENRVEQLGVPLSEIRYRELNASDTNLESLELTILPYETTATQEYFLQWVTPENKIAGFLRLSLPKQDYVHQHATDLPVGPREAMIREVHVYGKVAGINEGGKNAQHLGLGKQLIEAACAIAQDNGYTKINVISSIGTREYYRSLGFVDKTLYQQRLLSK